MKKKKLEMQYDANAKEYENLHTQGNEKSIKQFFKMISKYIKIPKRLKLIDLGCGSGTNFEFYQKKEFECFGLDASSEMLTLVKEKYPSIGTYEGSFASQRLHFTESFDVVVSKWAFQTTPKIQMVYEQVVRILKPQGYFIFLTVHPLRQFLEKKKTGKNYFKQEIVVSEIFDKQITVYEPTHTLQEYLSPYFLEHFELLEIKEDYEFPAAEQIGGDIYPTYLIIVARKK